MDKILDLEVEQFPIIREKNELRLREDWSTFRPSSTLLQTESMASLLENLGLCTIEKRFTKGSFGQTTLISVEGERMVIKEEDIEYPFFDFEDVIHTQTGVMEAISLFMLGSFCVTPELYGCVIFKSSNKKHRIATFMEYIEGIPLNTSTYLSTNVLFDFVADIICLFAKTGFIDFDNVRTENIIVTKNGLRLIDLGLGQINFEGKILTSSRTVERSLSNCLDFIFKLVGMSVNAGILDCFEDWVNDHDYSQSEIFRYSDEIDRQIDHCTRNPSPKKQAFNWD